MKIIVFYHFHISMQNVWPLLKTCKIQRRNIPLEWLRYVLAILLWPEILLSFWRDFIVYNVSFESWPGTIFAPLLTLAVNGFMIRMSPKQTIVISKLTDSVLFRMSWDDKKYRDLLCPRFIWITVHNAKHKDWLQLENTVSNDYNMEEEMFACFDFCHLCCYDLEFRFCLLDYGGEITHPNSGRNRQERRGGYSCWTKTAEADDSSVNNYWGCH